MFPLFKVFRRSGMYLNEYQREARKTAIYKSRIYPFLALAEEAGEVAGKIAKKLRKEGHNFHLTDSERWGVIDELGDVLWQLSACCEELKIPLGDVATINLDKLRSRAERNVLEGKGDNR